jgi:hypothetical protein
VKRAPDRSLFRTNDGGGRASVVELASRLTLCRLAPRKSYEF